MSNKSKSRDSKNTRIESDTMSITWWNRINQTWFIAALGAFFYWLSLPPMKFPLAGFLASACWVSIVARECPPTRREYWSIWIAGAAMWLALLQGIRLAYWPLYAGWIALSLYLAVYLPMFIAMARSLHRNWRIPLPLAVATAWVGFELIRAYFVTGFAACMLAHSQTPWPWMLPIASQFGSYGVSFMVMFIGAVLYQWLGWGLRRSDWMEAISKRLLLENLAGTMFSSLVIIASIGSIQSHDSWLKRQEPIKPLCTALLIQEDMPTQFDGDDDDAVLGWQRYEQQTALAAKTNVALAFDLVVWPESTFSGGPDPQFIRLPWFDWNEGYGFPPDLEISESQFTANMGIIQENLRYKLRRISAPFLPRQPVFLLGSDVLEMRNGLSKRYNAALWIEPNKLDAFSTMPNSTWSYLVSTSQSFQISRAFLERLDLDRSKLETIQRLGNCPPARPSRPAFVSKTSCHI